MTLKGLGPKGSKVVKDLRSPDVVLCRNNATVIAELFQALESGKAVGIVGDGRDLQAVANAAEALQAGRTTDHEEFALFKTWDEVVEYAESGDDPNLLRLTKIVDEHGPASIKHAINRATDVHGADLVLSTAHKAKGGEWERVRLAPDFAKLKQNDDTTTLPPRDELMLNYVAVTRAKQTLDRGILEWVDDAVRELRKGRLKPASPPRPATPTPDKSGEPLRVVPSAPGGLPYRTRHPDYASWTAGADAALLRRFRAGRTLAQLSKEFVRTSGEVESRLFVLLDRTPNHDAVFGPDGKPLLGQTTDGAPAAPKDHAGELPPLTEPPPHRAEDYYEPDPTDGLDNYEEPVDPLEGDPEIEAILEELDDWDGERADWEEEQNSIRATFEYLMERDDI